MLVHLCFVTLAVVAVQKGLCIRCYTCLSEDIYDSCYRFDKSKVPLKTCDRSQLENTEHNAKQIGDGVWGKLYEVDAAQEPLPQLNCLKQVIKSGNKHYILRGCQLAPSNNMDICIAAKRSNDDLRKTTGCSLCSGDGCNPATSKRPQLSVPAAIGVAYLAFWIYS